ncbi:MAG: restriction endonuclease subunit R, partial [Gammaproteobacteria bacterium]
AVDARKKAFQQTLLGVGDTLPCIVPGFDFEFPADNYPARFHYAGRYVFRKHFYGPPGELDSDITQEETACAIALDQMDEVEYWVRNLERRGAASFSLPTSTDAFYPDFVEFLRDGRVLVVEYKGWVYFTNEDSREKRDIGSVWATASKGRCRFVMVTAPSAVGNRTIEQQLRDAIA